MRALRSLNRLVPFLGFIVFAGFHSSSRGFETSDIIPRTLDGVGVCSGASLKDAGYFTAMAKMADAVFIGKVKSITSESKTRTVHIDVTTTWKGISVGKDRRLITDKRRLSTVTDRLIGRTFLVMAAGKPLVWTDCTIDEDVSELSPAQLSKEISAWSKWIGLKPKFK